MENGLTNLLQNKLFLQYLAGAGADISAGNPLMTNVNAITQQNIQSQNFMKLLQNMLGGEIPEGGKMTMDSKGMKMDIPSSALKGDSTGTSYIQQGGSFVPNTGIAGTAELNRLNPFL